jgi:DNA repair exonuclease SbcCD ATPase subunit
MFFARRKPEEVRIDRLDQFLNMQFEKKLGAFESRSHAITDNLNQALIRFGDACDRFEELEAEPYVEGRYSANISAIKTQKGRYVGSLKGILGGMRLEAGEAVNSYYRYQHILSDIEGMIKNVLETNANFKIVLYCYSNYLWDFKSRFSEIEKLAESLKSELGGRSEEFSEYSAVADHTSRLYSYIEELSALKKSVEHLNEGPRTGGAASPDKDGTGISKSIGDKKAELALLNRERSDLHDRITSLTLPLERASKKLDHLSAGRMKLHVLVEDPISAINDESKYGEFVSLVQELNKKIIAGSIDLKNGDKVSEAVAMLLNSDLYSMITSFRSCQQKESEVGREIEALEGYLNAIRNEKTASERHAQEAANIEGRVHEIERSKAAEKSAIEKLFTEHYGVLISIVG